MQLRDKRPYSLFCAKQNVRKREKLFQRNEQKMSAILTLFDKYKRLQSFEAFVTHFGMVNYYDVSAERNTSIRRVEY
jgi:dihydroorotase